MSLERNMIAGITISLAILVAVGWVANWVINTTQEEIDRFWENE